MKNIALILSIIFMGFAANASSLENDNSLKRGYNGNEYIFVEGDVEFSIFPDGQFDFIYIGPQKGSQVTISRNNVNVSFNSGYNYDTYVQYDDYGAVIQVENVPIYYDEYGRIIQAGNVDIQYSNRRIVRVGGLHVFYNNRGYFSHINGAINIYNPYYIYRPWHVYYAPPIYTHVIVYDMPYRRYYTPVRYSYHQHVIYYKNRNNIAYANARREFYRPGSRVYDKRGRSSINKDYNPNRTNTMIANGGSRTSSSIRNNNGRNGQNAASDSGRNNNVIRNSSTNSKGATVQQQVRNNNTSLNTEKKVIRENVGNPIKTNGTDKNIRTSNSRTNISTAPTKPQVKNSVTKPSSVREQTRNSSSSPVNNVRTRTNAPAVKQVDRSNNNVRTSISSKVRASKDTSRSSRSSSQTSTLGRG